MARADGRPPLPPVTSLPFPSLPEISEVLSVLYHSIARLHHPDLVRFYGITQRPRGGAAAVAVGGGGGANGSMYRSNDANASITRGGGPSKRLTLDPNADADLFLVLVGCQRFFEPTAGRQQRAAQTNQPPVAVLVLVLLGRIHGGHDWRVFVSSCSCVPTSTTAFAFALARATGWLPRHATMPRHGHRRSWSFALRRWHSC